MVFQLIFWPKRVSFGVKWKSKMELTPLRSNKMPSVVVDMELEILKLANFQITLLVNSQFGRKIV